MDAADLFPWLIAFFNTRYQSPMEQNLVEAYTGHPDFQGWDEDQLAAFFRRRRLVLSWAAKREYRERLSYCLAELTLASTPQGGALIFSEEHARRLQHIYDQAIKETLHLLQTAEERNWQPAYRMLLKCHFVRLHTVLASLLPPGQQQRWLSRDAMASEYAPEWQLSLFGLEPAVLAAPVLDVGCGKAGHLVAHLRGLGIEAYGVDRGAAGGPGLIHADWLAFHFEPSKWPLILSHLAFSNHAWFHFMSSDGQLEAYQNKFLEILNSLKPGGLFAYFPALPFMERILDPNRFQVQRHEVWISKTLVKPGNVVVPFYSSRILRLPEV